MSGNAPSDNQVLVIGAGMAGLSVATYLRMNGYETTVFESHTLPGGLCTSWRRGAYTFDGCIHWLMGSGPSKNLHTVWKELGAVQGRRFVEWDPSYMTVHLTDGRKAVIYTDPKRLEAELTSLAPEDAGLIRSFCRAVADLADFDFPIPGGGPQPDPSALFRGLPHIFRWSSVSVADVARRARNPALKELLTAVFDPGTMPDFSILAFLMMLAFMHRRSAGYPVGGSLAFAQAVEARLRSLGGTVLYGHPVERILVEKGAAVGVVAQGREFRGRRIVAACDGHELFDRLLEGRHTPAHVRRAFATWPLFPSLLAVNLGVAKTFTVDSPIHDIPLPEPIVAEDGALRIRRLTVRFLSSFDPTLAPEGHSVVEVLTATRNDAYWTALRQTDPERYRQAKSDLGRQIVDALERHLVPGIRDSVEVIDVATPATFIRYTRNHRGSYEGFLPTVRTINKDLGYRVKGLRNLYWIGQWVTAGGGLPPAAMAGRHVAAAICREDRRPFTAATP